MIHPPQGAAKAEPKVVQLFLLIFYPPKGLCEAEPEWGPFDILSILLCLEKGVWHLQFTAGNLPFLNLENALSPRGRLRMQLPRGSIEYSFHFNGAGNGTDTFNLQTEICLF